MIPDAALPVLAEALYVVGDEIGFNADDDARFVARHLEAAGWAIVPADDAPVPSRDGDPEEVCGCWHLASAPAKPFKTKPERTR